MDMKLSLSSSIFVILTLSRLTLISRDLRCRVTDHTLTNLWSIFDIPSPAARLIWQTQSVARKCARIQIACFQ